MTTFFSEASLNLFRAQWCLQIVLVVITGVFDLINLTVSSAVITGQVSLPAITSVFRSLVSLLAITGVSVSCCDQRCPCRDWWCLVQVYVHKQRSADMRGSILGGVNNTTITHQHQQWMESLPERRQRLSEIYTVAPSQL